VKILLTTGIFPPDIGGPATYVPFMAEALVQNGHDVTVVCLADDPKGSPGHYPFRLVRLPRREPWPARLARTVLCLTREGRGADVVFGNGLLLEVGLATALLRVPLVLKVVGDWAWERATNARATSRGFEEFQLRGDRRRRRWAGWLRSLMVRRGRAVIVPSEYLARWVAGWKVAPERIHVVHNAYLPEDAPEIAARPLATSRIIVSVGRLVPWKRVDQLIEIVAAHPSIGLAIVGDGPERGRLEALVSALGVRGRVRFTGCLERPATLALISVADLFVLNSTYEGLPHVVLEALGLGVPVLATAVGGTPEVVEHGVNGILVSPEDRAGLEAAIVETLNDRAALAGMARAARDSMVRFPPEEMVRQTLGVLAQASRPYPVETAGWRSSKAVERSRPRTHP
jgi:glycosyltransferase involved in cell wall biosynthesis